MSTLFEAYQALSIDSSLLSLERRTLDMPYFCYPSNAIPIGFEGCILYCFLPEYGEMVFASNPESCADGNVYPLAADFLDFLRLILACGSANPVEQIVWMSRERFEAHVMEEKGKRTEAHREALDMLARELGLAPMEDPFAYVKGVQAVFDGGKVQYSDAYYDTLGLARPDGTRGESDFAFPPVRLT